MKINAIENMSAADVLVQRGAVRLTKRVAVYIPSTVSVNCPVDSSVMVDKAAALLSSLFGGATATAAGGFWMSDSAGLVREGVTIVYAYGTDEQMRANLSTVVDFVERMRDEMQQEAVSVEYDGELFII